MQPLSPQAIVPRFAELFAKGHSGMKLTEIYEYFGRYQSGVPTGPPAGLTPTKAQALEACLASLSPENQRLALYDLCDAPPRMKGTPPTPEARIDLLRILVQGDGASELGLQLSAVTLEGVRRQWLTAASRLPASPAAAITAARTLVESTCKTILKERGETPDNSGDLAKLYKQTAGVIGLATASGEGQAKHQLVQGLVQAINGLAALSNSAGDRHGASAGEKNESLVDAGLAVHAAGTISLHLVQRHKLARAGTP